jgi:hypothetical protein
VAASNDLKLPIPSAQKSFSKVVSCLNLEVIIATVGSLQANLGAASQHSTLGFLLHPFYL